MKAALLQKLHRATDRHCAEMVTITPMQAGGYVVSCDLRADPAPVAAYVTETTTSVRTSGNNANSGHNAEMRGTTYAAKFETSALPFKAQAGDIVERHEVEGRPAFRVSAVWPFGTDRTILMLTKVDA